MLCCVTEKLLVRLKHYNTFIAITRILIIPYFYIFNVYSSMLNKNKLYTLKLYKALPTIDNHIKS